ncbi:unnamed protein product [Linum trigynum]|uniref:Uncharacterized protein n=1 Tax=Linum trigynum TaxID=586398 RepID=A0AAV2F5D2_9ROSI
MFSVEWSRTDNYRGSGFVVFIQLQEQPQTCCSWIMHEYCLLPIPALGLDSVVASKLALCRIRKKKAPGRKE